MTKQLIRPLVLIYLSLGLSGCYDELSSPVCFVPPESDSQRTLEPTDDAFFERYRELESLCIQREAEEDFRHQQCESLWMGEVDDAERARLYRLQPRLLTLSPQPIIGAELYARCLPSCEAERCECEADSDCAEMERCLGPRALGHDAEEGEALAFCVRPCTGEEYSSCVLDLENKPAYCELSGEERCYPSDPSPVEPPPVEPPAPSPQEPITADEYRPRQLVDPMIATGGELAEIASVSPGASAPLGLTLVGPDTSLGMGMFPAFHCAGYHYPDTHIQGFSHTHAHGMGVVDYGGISVMPRARWRAEYQSFEGRAATFDHSAESASPGEYSVTLSDDNSSVEIVATPHGAHHRYRFDPSVEGGLEPVVILDLGDNLVNTQSLSAQIQAEGAVVQAVQLLDGAYSGRSGGALHHATLRFDPAPISYAVWSDEGELVEGEASAGRSAGLVARFPANLTEVQLTVALSFVDLDGAQRNHEAELPDFDLEARRAEVRALWDERLDRVKVRASRPKDAQRFATAHYHSLLMPSLHSDVDGRYRGLDQELHQLEEGERYYSDLSLWDTFRTLHSFYLLAHPELQRDILKSLIRMSQDGGSLPRWPLAHGYTGGMVGSPAIQLFAEAYLKGLEGWDVDAAYEASLAQSDNESQDAQRSGGASYLSLGWVPADERSGSVSRTLEYAWSDSALALWAEARDRPEGELNELRRRGGLWRNHWDPEADEEGGFMVGRNADGSFVPLRVPELWDEVFVEGNAWHYLWYVPYDVEGMIELQHGGDREAFLSRSRDYWERVYEEEDDLLPDDYYWHGNEPVMHYAWLGSLAGDQALTVEASHHILETRYGHSPQDGLDGNDDSGTLSAWYLLASMGFYPIAGTNRYALGAPLFERVELHVPDQAPWSINAGGADWYRAPLRVSVGPEPEALTTLVEPSLSHQELMQGLWFSYAEDSAEGYLRAQEVEDE